METLINNNNSNNYNNTPLIFLIGPTGVGKSKIAVELAKKFNGEIINSDAFSFYKHADIMTAKATTDERNIVKHHLIDILELNDKSYKVIDYYKDYSQLLEKLFEDKVTPIVVGGTNYYVEHILFDKIYNESKFQLEEGSYNNIMLSDCELNQHIEKINDMKKKFDHSEFYFQLSEYLNSIDNIILIKLLKFVDPVFHNFLHKNDTRKIKNVIIYYFTCGERKSEKLSTEKLKLRFNNTFTVFLNPDLISDSNEFYDERIKKRIDDMLTKNKGKGLREIFEILDYFNEELQFSQALNFTEGVLQSIGYKEFYNFYMEIKKIDYKINNFDENFIEDLNIQNKLSNVYTDCRTKLINNSIKFAKSQIKFIRKRILPYIESSKLIEIKINKFTNQAYEEYVNQTEMAINEFISNLKHNTQESINNSNNERCKINKIINWGKYSCIKCSKELNGEIEYKSHMKSNKHKRKKKLDYKKTENKVENLSV